MTLDLYIGIPIDVNEEKKESVINMVNSRHPEDKLEAVLDGYWSGVEEVTFHIKVESTLEFAQETVGIIKVLLSSSFVALCEADE